MFTCFHMLSEVFIHYQKTNICIIYIYIYMYTYNIKYISESVPAVPSSQYLLLAANAFTTDLAAGPSQKVHRRIIEPCQFW